MNTECIVLSGSIMRDNGVCIRDVCIGKHWDLRIKHYVGGCRCMRWEAVTLSTAGMSLLVIQ